MSTNNFTVQLAREDGVTLPGIALDADDENAARCNGAGVVILAGEWGLEPAVIEQIARPLAKHGFHVVATDLVGGHVAATREEAQTRGEGIAHASAILDLEAAIRELKKTAFGKIGVVGLDLGATIALEAATQLPQIDAVVHAGGPPPGPHVSLARLRSAVLVIRAERGTRLTAADYTALVARAEPSKAMFTRAVYPADDGFFTHPADDDQRSEARIAMDRVRDFLVASLT